MKNEYEATLAFLYEQLPMFQNQGKTAFKKDLSNIQELCWRLGLPQWQFKSVHIGGTNGKGSVSAMMASILQQEGYKVGLYTSPHLKSFTERIKVNGKEIGKKDVINFVKKNKKNIEEISPSFFELTVAMAFDYFARKEVDIAVVEVGLGGRLDSTNIIRPELSIITNISLDHQSILGESLPEIAAEKAGIIKSHTPIVIGQKHKETEKIFQQKAKQEDASIHFAEENIKITQLSNNLHGQTLTVQSPSLFEIETKLHLGLSGDYQQENVKTVIASLEVMHELGWKIAPKSVKNGLKNVQKRVGFYGRMHLLQEAPYVICDTAHNIDGVTKVFEQLQKLKFEKLHIVWGMVIDKDIGPILELLPRHATYYFVTPKIQRALSSNELFYQATNLGLKGDYYSSIELGMQQAKQNATPKDLIFAGGSTFVVAEVL